MAQSDSKDQETKTDLQLKLARISFYKTVATLFFGSALAVILTHIIKQQEVNMAKAKNYQLVQKDEEDNLQRYFKYTMDGDIYDRLKLAAFFKEILTEEKSRRRWADYYKLLNKQLRQWNRIANKIAAMEEAGKKKTNPNYAKLLRRREHLEELTSAVNVEIAAVDAPHVEIAAVDAPHVETKAVDTPYKPGMILNVPGAEPTDQARYWPVKDHLPDPDFQFSGSRKFGAPRPGGKRRHAGVILIAPEGAEVVAPEDAEVIRGPYYFYSGTNALELKTERGLILRFGILHMRGVRGIVAGADVKAGDVIGYVGRLKSGSSYLKLEMYAGTASGRLTRSGNIFARRSDLLDPTPYLMELLTRLHAESPQEAPQSVAPGGDRGKESNPEVD